MSTLAVEIKRSAAQGDKVVAGGFSGAIRSLENPGLELNDEWTFPENYEVRSTKIGENSAEYIFIEVTNGQAKTVKKFFPGTFTKSRAVVNEDKTATGVRAVTKGTAAEKFREYGSIQEGMDAMKGKHVKVTNLETVRCIRFGTDSLMNAQIPTIDLVEA